MFCFSKMRVCNRLEMVEEPWLSSSVVVGWVWCTEDSPLDTQFFWFLSIEERTTKWHWWLPSYIFLKSWGFACNFYCSIDVSRLFSLFYKKHLKIDSANLLHHLGNFHSMAVLTMLKLAGFICHLPSEAKRIWKKGCSAWILWNDCRYLWVLKFLFQLSSFMFSSDWAC